MRILDKHVGLMSIHTEQVRTGKFKTFICEIALVQTLKSCMMQTILYYVDNSSLFLIASIIGISVS
nr:MAG TPA_asm: hypothetical protein [Bacteriophage sp.]